MLLQLRSSIEVDILLRQQLNRHIVDRLHFFLQDYSLEERVNTAIALLVAVLGNEERYAALAQTFCIFGYHVVTHYLYITSI